MKVMEWKMSSMNFACDVCGREVFSCTFVNGMKFCAKCYQETFGETDKDRKIADLEAKLAEREKEISEVLAKQSITCLNTIEKAYQDKISFAVEQLEKLKKFTEKEIKECKKLLQEELEDDYYIQSVNARQSMCYEFKREIDNQIKQLKEMVANLIKRSVYE